MSNKIGRNDPCPCGSGKKYKKCCIGKSFNEALQKSKIMTPIKKLLTSYDRFDLLKANGALQLLPINHGKNIRFEIFGREVMNNSKAGLPKVTSADMMAFFKKNFISHYLEDPVSSFFTENVIWFFGDYTVFPGLNLDGTRILNFFLETIFTKEKELPEEFKSEVRDGVMMILSMSESMAMSAGLKRFEYKESPDSIIQVPNEVMFKHLKDTVSFKKEHLEKISKHYSVSINGLNHFTLDPNDPDLNDDDPDNNPLLFRPIVKNGEHEFIFVLPTAIVNCLNHFIRDLAIQKGCLIELMNHFYDHQWNATKTLLLETGWRETDIVLPITALKVKESVFRFDNEKLAYVCFIMVGSSQPSTEKKEANIEQEGSTISPIEKRNKEVIRFLEELNGASPYRYFTVNILGESGQDAYFMYGKPEKDNQSLSLKYGELEKLVFSGELDILTLWKFAKVYNQSRLQTRLFSMGGVLDAFVAYQSNNESLLPSETAIPNFIHFPIGSSDDFGRKSIIKVDEHSALQNTDQYGLLPIPVRRMRDFAPIYKERENSKAHNLLLECFQCPVWVKNNQAKSHRDKEMINHYSEAIIFWLYKMRHELQPFFNQFKNIDPVEFELILTQELINPPEKRPKAIEEKSVLIEFSASKEINCITVKLPTEILSSFFRSDNLGEKELMKATLSGFSDLLRLKTYNVLDKDIIPALINKYLSPDSAKMILYFDTTNELRLDDRGLPPFRSIQESEISLILDNLVSYLNLKKPIPEKIERLSII